jgi:hypothetical protein
MSKVYKNSNELWQKLDEFKFVYQTWKTKTQNVQDKNLNEFLFW